MNADQATAVDAAVETLVVPAPPLEHTAESVLLSVMASVDEAELNECRHALIASVPVREWNRDLDLTPPAASYFGCPRLSPQRAIARQRLALVLGRREPL